MTIAQIKQSLSIMTVLSHYNLKANRNNMLPCPFHEDKKPSMRVYPETNTAYCFAGTCDIESLDGIDFIMRMEGCSKHEAILKAKTLSGETPKARVATSIKTKTDLSTTFTRYIKSLHNNRKAQEYCESRGLNWRSLEIGYKSKATKEKWGRDCIIFPLKNAQGLTVSLYGRAISGEGHYYQTGRSGLYPGYPDADTKTLILTESIIDAASIKTVGLEQQTLSLFGVNGLTTEVRQAIISLKNLEEIVFAFDGDEAGRQATQEHAKALKNYKLTTLDLAEGEDINSLVAAGVNLEELIKNRKAVHQPKQSTLNAENPYNLIYTTTHAIYYIKGGIRYNTKDLDSLKVTLVIENERSNRSRNKLDLYEDKQVEKVSRIAAEKLDLRADLIELDLQKLTDELEAYRETIQEKTTETKITLPLSTKTECLDFLKSPKLLQRINERIGASGLAGEENNRLLLFIIASSYAMPQTLHGLIQGSSGSGKTRLLKTVSHLMPGEDVKSYTRVTDGSFYNQGEYYFKNKLLCFEDIDGLKEEALLAVRELQSNEILITATSIKDEHGRISGGERVVRGPIASLACTTRAEVYEDNISRCFVIAVDESADQTMRIIKYQNEKSAGLINEKMEEKNKIFLQNCLRLIRPHQVINPYAHKIQLPKEAHKIRRLNELYQSFVRQITLLNQYQRKRDKTGRIISEKADLKQACDILFESIILKVDELDGSLRQFFERLKKYVKARSEDYEFNRFEVRKATGVSKTQQHYYTRQLVELEYIKQWGFANRGYKYRIAEWDNMSALRSRIRTELEKQLNNL